jgi:hypothetical protein
LHFVIDKVGQHLSRARNILELDMQRVDNEGYHALQLTRSDYSGQRARFGGRIPHPTRFGFFIRKVSYVLRLVVIVQLEVFEFEAADRPVTLVAHQDVDLHKFGRELYLALIWLLLVLLTDCKYRDGDPQDNQQTRNAILPHRNLRRRAPLETVGLPGNALLDVVQAPFRQERV